MLKLDAAAQRFKALAVPYNGSFFGIAAAGNAVVAFGLRGNVYRSDDGGPTWAKVDAGLPAAVVGAARTGATARSLLADAGGRIVATQRRRTHLRADRASQPPMPLTGFVDIGDGRFVLVGPRGVAVAETAAR